MSNSVLIVDDDAVQRRLLENIVDRLGYRVQTAESGKQALSLLKQAEQIDVVVLDLMMPEMDGHDVLEALQSHPGSPPVIVQTAQGGIDTVVRAMRGGATDFIVKPASPERLSKAIQSALKVEAAQQQHSAATPATDDDSFDLFVTRSAQMERVIDLARRAAKSDIPVLIEGESGVGKERIARTIRAASQRNHKKLVTVNCGAIPENLVESILFGHEKGAFTGATEKHIGKFQEADQGTLFLDEVGELPLDIQVRLLRAIQEKEIDPVGAKKPSSVDFRLVSATNQNLMALVQAGDFREDLFYRLNVFPIRVPPLRDRIEDVPDLARKFVANFAARENKQITGIDQQAMAMLCAFNWPGNIRQLENTVFRAVVLAEQSLLSIDDFPQIQTLSEFGEIARHSPAQSISGNPVAEADELVKDLEFQKFDTAESGSQTGADLQPAAATGQIPLTDDQGDVRKLADLEAEIIRQALIACNGSVSKVARQLGVGRSTLYRKFKEYGLEDTDDLSAA